MARKFKTVEEMEDAIKQLSTDQENNKAEIAELKKELKKREEKRTEIDLDRGKQIIYEKKIKKKKEEKPVIEKKEDLA